MADFVAVLKKTLDGLGPTTPDMRDKVYDKARATVTAKLDAISPPPPAAVRDRQMAALEDAIATIERGHSDRPRKPASPLDELEEVFASLSGLKERDKAPPPPRLSPPRPASPTPAQPGSAPQAGAAREVAPPPPPPAPPADALPGDEPVLAAPRAEDTFVAEERDDDIAAGEPVRPSRPRRSYGGLVATLVVLAVAAGGGYGVWLNKDAFAALFSSDPAAPKQAAAPATPEPEAEQAAAPAKPPAEPEPPTEVAAATPDDATAPADPPKYTQRLNADGSETDMGAAEAEPMIGEGTSVAQATQPSEPAANPDEPAAAAPAEPEAPATPDAAEPDAAAQAPAEPEAVAPPAAEAALPVGQKAIFYEERTSSAQGSAEPGNIVWSLVQESPGGDLPPEPAIQAQASIPGKDLQLRMIIRRNGDRTLPASHIIEMIFITPEGFEGGGVDNVLRVAMKNSEQEAGSPLLGIPAKIADGYFLIALNDAKPEVEANLSLLRRQSWIDVPMVYKSGRRALFTMEKGIPGEKVFEEAMKAWGNAGNG